MDSITRTFILVFCVSHFVDFGNCRKLLDDCGSMDVQPCKIHTSYGAEAQGYMCDTSNNNTCLLQEDWCHFSKGFQFHEQCRGFENMMFDSCLSWDTKIEDYEYHVNVYQAEWHVAEQYCQNRQSHLLSLSSQMEFNKIIELLMKFGNDPKKISTTKNVRLHDKLAQRCWDSRHAEYNKYWTGLFYDQSDQSWKYSDGSQVVGKVVSGFKSIDSIIQKENLGSPSFVSFFDQNLTFHQAHETDVSRVSTATKSRARIICKRDTKQDVKKFKLWEHTVEPKNIGCLSGFKCEAPEPKCIVGPMFTDTEVCNGVIDCYYGEDESKEYCSYFTTKSQNPEDPRVLHFLPYRRSPSVAKRFCKAKNYTLPTIHSPYDIDRLLALPLNYSDSLATQDFSQISENWKNLKNFKILIGVHGNSNKWDDGSVIDFRNKEIKSLPTDHDVYLLPDGTFKDMFEQKEPIFVICQEYSHYASKSVGVQKKPVNHADSQYVSKNFINFTLAFFVMISLFSMQA